MSSWIEETLMILPPPPASIMSFAAVWAAKNAPLRLTPTTRSKCASLTSVNGSRISTPALLTRMSRRPRASCASRTRPSASLATPTFAPSATDFLPSFSISAETARALSPPLW